MEDLGGLIFEMGFVEFGRYQMLFLSYALSVQLNCFVIGGWPLGRGGAWHLIGAV